jgi:hypothetical protein
VSVTAEAVIEIADEAAKLARSPISSPLSSDTPIASSAEAKARVCRPGRASRLSAADSAHWQRARTGFALHSGVRKLLQLELALQFDGIGVTGFGQPVK